MRLLFRRMNWIEPSEDVLFIIYHLFILGLFRSWLSVFVVILKHQFLSLQVTTFTYFFLFLLCFNFSKIPSSSVVQFPIPVPLFSHPPHYPSITRGVKCLCMHLCCMCKLYEGQLSVCTFNALTLYDVSFILIPSFFCLLSLLSFRA